MSTSLIILCFIYSLLFRVESILNNNSNKRPVLIEFSQPQLAIRIRAREIARVRDSNVFVLHIIVIESASSASAFNVLSGALLNTLDAGSATANQRDDAKSAMLILFYDW